VDLSQVSPDEAYNYVKQCAQLVYRELMKASAFDAVDMVVNKLSSKISLANPTYYVVETPRRFEFSSRITDHRLAPYPVLAITAPTTPEGLDLPIRYDTIPTVVVDPRRIVDSYADSIKELIEKAKRYRVLITDVGGNTVAKTLELKTDVTGIMYFVDYIYNMSYDRDYPPAEPPELYVEGFYYETEFIPNLGSVELIECNMIGYKTTTGEYYSGYGGVIIVVNNVYRNMRRVRVMGRNLFVQNYSIYTIVFSNLFSLYAYKS